MPCCSGTIPQLAEPCERGDRLADTGGGRCRRLIALSAEQVRRLGAGSLLPSLLAAKGWRSGRSLASKLRHQWNSYCRSIRRTAVYGPCTAVWEGGTARFPPYPDCRWCRDQWAARARLMSGGVASSTSAAMASSSGSTVWRSLPSRRTETDRPSASFLPTTSSAGIFASECSRTL